MAHRCDRCGAVLNGVDQGEVWESDGSHLRLCHGLDGRESCYVAHTVLDHSPFQRLLEMLDVKGDEE